MLNAPMKRREMSFSVAMIVDEEIGDIVGAIDRRGRVLVDVVNDCVCRDEGFEKE